MTMNMLRMREQDMSYEAKRNRIFSRQRARNGRAAKRKMVIGFLTMTIVLMMSLRLFTVACQAQGNDEQKFKYYTSVRLNYGDTLWSIADQYMDEEYYDHFTYIAEVKSINHIQNGDEVMEGKTIIIPYYSTEYRAD